MARRSEHIQIRVTPGQKAALRELAARAGQDMSSYVLSRALPVGAARLEALVRSAGEDPDARYALAALNDYLSDLAPVQLGEAVRDADVSALTPFLQNYVAAMVEQACARRGVAPPSWVRDVAPMTEPWFAGGLRSLRPHLLMVSPVPFKRRNLFVDASVGARV